MSKPPSLKKRLESLGLSFTTEAAVLENLARQMGKERYERLLRVLHADLSPQQRSLRLTRTLQSRQEALGLCSLDACTTVELLEQTLPLIGSLIEPRQHLLDLGCGAGHVTALLAEQLPLVRVTGVDRARRRVLENRQELSREGLGFRHWDYAKAPPASLPQAELLFCLFGLENETTSAQVTDWPIDWAQPDGHPLAQVRRKQVAEVFAHWRMAAATRASLVTMLRIPDPLRALGTIQAARDAGWYLDLSTSSRLRASGQNYPLMRFSTEAIAEPGADEFLRWWWKSETEARGDSAPAFTDCIDVGAILSYLALEGHEAGEEVTGYDPLHGYFRCQWGHYQGRAYRMSSTTGLKARLEWLSEAEFARQQLDPLASPWQDERMSLCG